ncbi:YaaA family protein [Microcella humidisoli]|uniref:Peroxide stress protein YaaA n=1 Tax=Microcella humidisoli TaxID=2963406 RepID=A0ABY5FWH3_9MICO|nr:peroxide stress protein YaaA [Microcella humidisoli]UTT62650.1 peroxide stress protein YaaA [Microcella humidisoli]
MRFLLPPSETKRDGGLGAPLDLAALSFPMLTDARRAVLDALAQLSTDDAAAARALKLGAKAAPLELARNRQLERSGTMPAIERYTGVLYDALDVGSWGADARARASRHLMVHSALFGLVAADDAVPAYRLSHDTRLPGLVLRSHWAPANAAVLAACEGPFIDLRSEGYAALGPLPARDDALFVRVVAIGDDGVARALNHFNKKGKGEYLRALLQHGPVPASVDELCAISTALGWPLRRSRPGELELVVPGTLPPR